MTDSCVVCKDREATRIVTWETAGSRILTVCDTDALDLASLQINDWQNITIRPIDAPFGSDEEFYIHD